MRKFYLTNAAGQQIDLNEKIHFFHKPSGLGMEKKVSYEQIGDFFLALTDENAQKQIEGEMFFADYAEYRDFVRFAERKPLTLAYVTDEVFYIDVTLNSIRKSEREVGGLHCKIKLVGISQFYKKVELRNTSSDVLGKAYNYKYNYQYTNGQASNLEFDVKSSMNSPTKMTIIGPATNPSWNHRVNGEIVTTGRIRRTIPAGRRIVVDTTKIPYSIIETDNNGDNPEDIYQFSDFSTGRFVIVKEGLNAIRVAHEGDNDLNLVIERRELYATI